MAASGDWDPLKELLTVQKRMNRLFESALARTDFEAREGVDTWSPVADAYETPEALVICVELPGLEQDQIDVRVEGDELVVAGERKLGRESQGEHFHRVERSYGKFMRRFKLPSGVDRGGIEASYRNGLLRITVPAGEGRQSRPIQVSVR